MFKNDLGSQHTIKHSLLCMFSCAIMLCNPSDFLSQKNFKKARNYRHKVTQQDRLVFDQAVILSREKIYFEAARNWQELSELYPSCGNYRYHYGVSLFKAGGPLVKVEEILDLVVLGADHLIVGSGEYNEKNCAPAIDVLVYLAMVKHRLLKFDEASTLLIRFFRKSKKWNPLRSQADDLLRTIDVAVSMMANPVEVSVINLGEGVNSLSDETHPIIRTDEKELFFTSYRDRKNGSNYGFYDPETKKHYGDIYVVNRDVNKWGESEWVDLDLPKHAYAVAISPFGEKLTISHKNGLELETYTSLKRKGKWQRALLSHNISDIPTQGVTVFSPDGRVAIMSIEDKKGLTGSDLYEYTMRTDGTWSLPTKLGDEINTDYNETNPFFSADGTLFFSSNGLYGLGGMDCYSTNRENGVWSPPVNLGYPINTVDDDSYFTISAEGTRAYISSRRNRIHNDYDIFEIVFNGDYKLVNGNILFVNAPVAGGVNRVTLTSVTTGAKKEVGFFIDNKFYIRALIFGGSAYRINYLKDGVNVGSEIVDIPANIGYQVYTNLIDLRVGGMFADGIDISKPEITKSTATDTDVEAVIPEPEPEVITKAAEVKPIITGSSELNNEKWEVHYILPSGEIHSKNINIVAMVSEVQRLISKGGHPEILLRASAFQAKDDNIDQTLDIARRRTTNIFLRMKSQLKGQGYIITSDYSFLPIENELISDEKTENPDFIHIEISTKN